MKKNELFKNKFVLSDMKKGIMIITMFCFIQIMIYESASSEEQLPVMGKDVKIVFDFNDTAVLDNWVSVNDDVMGGISVGKALIEDSSLIFTGNLSMENNGGFSSIRTKPTDFGLSEYSGLRIKVKGDGRTYQFRIRTDTNFDGVAYKAEFITKKDIWVEVELPFSLFKATFRGNILDNIPPIDASKIKQVGFLIADKQETEFRLVIDKIVAVKE